MSVRCPWCDVEGARGEVHRHLADAHPGVVTITVDEPGDRRFYAIVCPVCEAPWDAEIKPRGRDPLFLEQYDREIRLVAFDMLLYHMEGEHPPDAGEPPGRAAGTAE